MANRRQRTEFGDFQTPVELAAAVCRTLARRGVSPASILEPTCGQGSLLLAALQAFPTAGQAIGVEINSAHLATLEAAWRASGESKRLRLVHADFFQTAWPALVAPLPRPLLVIGNPPWVTNSQLGALESANLPKKENRTGLVGLDALTGKSNFDISEWIVSQAFDWLDGQHGVLAMLCKTAVARRLLAAAWKNRRAIRAAALYEIDAARHFGAAVDACLLVCEFEPGAASVSAAVFDRLDDESPSRTLAWRGRTIVADAHAFDAGSFLAADGPASDYCWRSGVKHDCAAVMELRRRDDRWWNKLGDAVDIEPTHVFPLRKGSEIARGLQPAEPPNWLIVPQAVLNADTRVLREEAPRTWSYLFQHAARFDARKSSIYHNKPKFAVFGVGDYTFAPYKVAISGLHKRLHFEVVGPHAGRPVVFDDTVYFLSCRTESEARLVAAMLASPAAREFYSAYIFWDMKRPITADILRRLDLRKLAHHLGRLDEFEHHLRRGERAFSQPQLF